MSYNAKVEAELARGRRFLKYTHLSDSYSVAVRTNKSQGDHYALIQNKGGHTKTVHKGYDIFSLMAYFTAGNNDYAEAWWKSYEQPKKPAPADTKNSPIDIIFNSAPTTEIQQENQNQKHKNQEKENANKLFNSIKPDLVKAMALELKKDYISMIDDSMENNIIDEIKHSLQSHTKEVLERLSTIREFNYFYNMYKLLDEVIAELCNRNIKVYKAGVYRNPGGYGEEIIQGWYSCDKKKISQYAKDMIEEQFIGGDYTEEQKQRLRACFFCE